MLLTDAKLAKTFDLGPVVSGNKKYVDYELPIYYKVGGSMFGSKVVANKM